MNGYMVNYGMYKLMMLVNLEGDVLAVNTVTPENKPLETASIYEKKFKDAPWFKKTLNKEFLKGKTLTGTVVEQPEFNPIVGNLYHEDGFTLTFSAPVYDEQGKMVAVWCNFADFSLVEDIVKTYYQYQKTAGNADTAIDVINSDGIALISYDPEASKSDILQRDRKIINTENFARHGVPGAELALKNESGTAVMMDPDSNLKDAVGYHKSTGAYDYPGLGWSVLVHVPETTAFASIYAAKQELLLIVGVAALAIVLLGALIGTIASRPLRKSSDMLIKLAKGDYMVDVADAGRKDELGDIERSMVQLRGAVAINARQQTMIENLSTPVLLCDKDFKIIYANKISLETLQKLAKYLPVPVEKIVGSNIDIFHKNPSHQRGMLSRLGDRSHKTEFPIGDEWLALNATMLKNGKGEFDGAFIDWNVITEQKFLNLNYVGQIDAILKSQAVIEFNMDGTIITANDNFLKAMGYSMDEISGKHHSMFAPAGVAESQAYREFWAKLNRGEYDTGEYQRVGKGGKEIWIQASYNPILDGNRKPFKVVKYATEITQAKLESMEGARLKLALDTCTANVMMADANLNIIYMNDALAGFLRQSEQDIQKDLPRFNVANIIGSNIDVFHKNPSHQRGMLAGLNAPVKTSIQVGGKSFNLVAAPIFGKDKERLGTMVEWQDGAAVGLADAINKSQAVIEFLPDGTIVNANNNFLSVMGYSLDEIKGKHHSIFADPAYKGTAEYRQFWDTLNRGEPQTGEFKRFAKGNREIWINATYNPIFDLKNKVVRVVKTATDVTQMVIARTENELGMNEAVKVLTGLSQGDLTQTMALEYKGTFSQIKAALNATIDRLKDTVLRIKESAESVNAASSEISAGSTDLSQRTEQQASSLEETAASMEEITGTVRQNSENAKNANHLSAEAREVAERGGQVVGDAVTAMNSIEKSSQKISDIISVIDEIAFQTNLLALNAAVEAARAGDAGKGFAVVASEVRSLAGRSASASKEIKALIMESSAQVKTGAELVNQAGETLNEIVGSVKKVAEIIAEISNASTEQSTGIDEINTAVSQMDEMTQQNAALVEENTAAAQSLVQQAQALGTMVAFFRVDESAAHEAQGFEPVIVQTARPAATKPNVVSKGKGGKHEPAKPKAAGGGRNPVLADRKIIASANGTSHDREWEEF